MPWFTQTLVAAAFAIASVSAAFAAEFEPPAQPLPHIASITKKNGKGIPNGSSDSAEPFFELEQLGTDPTYGYTPENPIKVGSEDLRKGSSREKFYLNALRSSTGQAIAFERIGSCCHFQTPHGMMDGTGMLDVFKIIVPGVEQPRILYINMYDRNDGVLSSPMGFSIRKN